MTAEDIKREYTITFNGRPNLYQIQRELNLAEKSFGQFVDVEITTSGSCDPALEEVYMTLRSTS
jgi:hypothetical protein